MADSFFVLPMQMYLADCVFPEMKVNWLLTKASVSCGIQEK